MSTVATNACTREQVSNWLCQVLPRSENLSHEKDIAISDDQLQVTSCSMQGKGQGHWRRCPGPAENATESRAQHNDQRGNTAKTNSALGPGCHMGIDVLYSQMHGCCCACATPRDGTCTNILQINNIAQTMDMHMKLTTAKAPGTFNSC